MAAKWVKREKREKHEKVHESSLGPSLHSLQQQRAELMLAQLRLSLLRGSEHHARLCRRGRGLLS